MSWETDSMMFAAEDWLLCLPSPKHRVAWGTVREAPRAFSPSTAQSQSGWYRLELQAVWGCMLYRLVDRKLSAHLFFAIVIRGTRPLADGFADIASKLSRFSGRIQACGHQVTHMEVMKVTSSIWSDS